MAQKRKPPAADEQHVRHLLDRYACLVPYHEVRTRFLGNIATPAMSASPLRIVQGLWGGELPVFETPEDLNELIGALVNGLWNALTRHQKRTEPFRLTRVTLDATVPNLAMMALIRRQELDGFVEGLFDGKDEIDLPEKANSAIGTLGEIRSMMAGIHEMAKDDNKPAEVAEIEQAFKHIRELTKIAEKEIHVVVLDCTRVRRQMLSTMGSPGPTRH